MTAGRVLFWIAIVFAAFVLVSWESFPTESVGTRMVEPKMEAAGIEPASEAAPTERLQA
jgi:hypothetical protein